MGNSTTKTFFNYLQILGDLLLVNMAIIFAFLIRFQGDLPWFNIQPYLKLIPFITVIAFFIFNFYGLYHTVNKRWTEVFASLLISVIVLMVSTIVLSYMIGGFSFPRIVFLLGALMQLIMMSFWRWWMLKVERRNHPPMRFISVGSDKEIGCIVDKVSKNYGKVIGVVTEEEDFAVNSDNGNLLGSFDEALEVCRQYRPDAVILSGDVPDKIKDDLVQGAISYGWEIYVVPKLYEIMLSQTTVDQIDDTLVLKINSNSNKGKNQVKRFMDVVMSLIALFILSPIMIFVALAIKIDSKGPVFYRQERIGIGGKRIVINKFRTMKNDAELATGPVLASENDSRITRVGKYLRASRIDELPQFINVLLGDMSLVGPRPERPFFVSQFEKDIPGYSCRHATNVGITGLAQIMGNYSTSTEDKLRYDLLYTKNSSPFFDLKILLQTMKVVLMKSRAS